jgi:hypothetical protein
MLRFQIRVNFMPILCIVCYGFEFGIAEKLAITYALNHEIATIEIILIEAIVMNS